MATSRLGLRRLAALALSASLVLGGCGGDVDGEQEASTTTTAPGASTTMRPDPGYEVDLEALADDAMEGRDNGSPGSERAQEYLVSRLEEFAEPSSSPRERTSWA